MVLHSVKLSLLSLFLYRSWNPVWVNQYEKKDWHSRKCYYVDSKHLNMDIDVLLLVYNELTLSWSLLKEKNVNGGLRYGLMLGNMGFESKALIGWQDGYIMNTKERDFEANTLFDQHFNSHQQDKRTKHAYSHTGKKFQCWKSFYLSILFSPKILNSLQIEILQIK